MFPYGLLIRELTVKVISTSDIGNVMVLGEHKRGVRAVSWSPDGSIIVNILASAHFCDSDDLSIIQTTTAQDGNIYVWGRSSSGQWSLTTTIPGIVPAVHDDG